MQITSNIAGVIRQTERLRENIPVAIERALSPAVWLPEAIDVATRVLEALAQGNEKQMIASFVQTIKAVLLQGGERGVSITMQAPVTAGSMENYQAARASMNPGDLFSNLFRGNVQEFEDLMLKWVQTEKNKDKRDFGKTDEEIALLISRIMLTPSPTLPEAKARKSLLPHIEDFLRRQMHGGLDPVTVDMWLRTVLAAWRELFRANLLPKIKGELHAMSEEL